MLHLLDIIPQGLEISNVDALLQRLTDVGVSVGKSILAAVAIYVVGRWVVNLLNRLFRNFLLRSKVEPTVQTFLSSLVNILLTILLVVMVVSALGVNTTSFAALLASAGVAVGMALSGNLSNFAGGLVILLLKPYKVGDVVEAQGLTGTVAQIQIFHTVIELPDRKRVYIPNTMMSTAVVVNCSQSDLRRVDWTLSIAYGNDVEHAREVINRCLDSNPHIETAPVTKAGVALPARTILVKSLGASSVDLVVRVYVKNEDYWDVYHTMLETFYKEITADAQLDIPFTTQTIHIAGGEKPSAEAPKGGEAT